MMRGQNRWANRVIGLSMILLVALLIAQVVHGYFISPSAVMHIAGARFDVRIADDDKSRINGLSGTSDLPSDEAMVFIFDYSNRWSIWMKDMNYSIDIVWLDESKKVVDFVTNVSPASYPNKTFIPKEPALYVVEFRSGTVEEKGIKVGQEVVFSGTSKKI